MDDGHQHAPHDGEIAALLQRLRPVGPPAGLRARIVGARQAPPAWPWAAAAAAALAMVIGLPAWSARLAEATLPPFAATETPIDTLASLLGGGEQAHRTAALILTAEQMRVERDGGALTGHIVPVQP